MKTDINIYHQTFKKVRFKSKNKLMLVNGYAGSWIFE